jgi:MFS family permease
VTRRVDPHRPRTGAWDVLRRRDLRWLLLSFGISRLGDFLYTVALIVYIFDRTGSAAWVAAATLARFVPYVVVSPLGGLIADRYHRRTVMVASELTSMAAMAAITVTAAMSGPAVVVIALVTVAACAATLYQACGIAMVQDVLPENELATGNSLFSTVDNIAFVAGPAGGALLLLLGSPTIAFGVNTATFVLSALFLSRVRARGDGSGEQAATGRALRAGLAAFVGNRAVLVLVGCLVAGNVVYGLELVVLVLVSSELLGTGAEGVGWLLAASGIGGVAGAAISARLASTARTRTTTAGLVLLSGLPLASLAAIPLPVIAYALLVVEGIAIICLDVLVNTAIQRLVAPPLLGRVAGLTLSLTSVGTATGTLLAPVLVELLGLVPTLVLVGVVPVSIAAAALALVPELNARLDRTRLALAPRVALLRRLQLLSHTDHAGLERLAASAVPERAAAGTVLLRQGDPADDLLVLVQGTLAVDHEADGAIRRVNNPTAPDYVGEIGLVHHTPRTATVTAASDVTLWRVPGPVFLDAVSGNASAALLGGIASRIIALRG